MKLTEQDILQFFVDSRGLEGIDADTALFSDGTVDSVGMIELIGYIEEEEDFEVGQADVTLENFDTVNLILSYIKSKVAE